jgi:hypothetical protein
MPTHTLPCEVTPSRAAAGHTFPDAVIPNFVWLTGAQALTRLQTNTTQPVFTGSVNLRVRLRIDEVLKAIDIPTVELRRKALRSNNLYCPVVKKLCGRYC